MRAGTNSRMGPNHIMKAIHMAGVIFCLLWVLTTGNDDGIKSFRFCNMWTFFRFHGK